MPYLLIFLDLVSMNSVMPETFLEKRFIKNSGSSPENTVFSSLSRHEREIYDLILNYWPTSSIEIAEHFNENISSRENRRTVSTRYSYYLKKLVDKKLVLSKRVGNALIVWPFVVEKYRVIHDILREK